MPREEYTTALGLMTAINRQDTPPGALLQAQDACIDRPGVVEPRPGFVWSLPGDTPSTTVAALNLVGYAGHLLSLLSAVCIDETATAAVTGFAAPPAPTQRGYATTQARGSLYATGSTGVQKLDAVAGPWQKAGLQRALAGTATNAATSAWLATTHAVAYRMVLRRTDANTYIRRSAPSGRLVYYNSTGGAVAVTLTIDLQDDVTTGDVLEIYRAPSGDGTVGLPSDQMYLIAELNLTGSQISAKSVTFTDNTSDIQLTGGTELYTNESQQGILQQKDRPPWCTDLALYNRMTFFGDTRPAWRSVVKLWNSGEVLTGAFTVANVFEAAASVPPGVPAGSVTASAGGQFTWSTGAADMRALVGCIIVEGAPTTYPGTVGGVIQAFTKIVSATFSGGVGSITVNKSSLGAGTVATTVWPTMTVGGVDAYGTDRNHVSTLEWNMNATGTNTLLALYTLAHIINVQSTTVSAWFEQTGGAAATNLFDAHNIMPVMIFEWRDLSQSTAPTIFWNDCAPDIFSTSSLSQPQFGSVSGGVYTPGSQPFTSDVQPGTIFVSETDEPEAVPPVNFVQIGDATKTIRRMVATRSALWVFKDDGLFRVAGYSPDALSVDLIDPTLRLLRSDAACASADVAYAWTTKGVVACSDAGVRPLSEPIRDQLINSEQLLASYPASSAGAWMVYDQTERRVVLGVPLATGQTAASLCYVWSERTGGWSTWVLTPNCATWDPGTGQLTVSTLRHPGGSPLRYTDREALRSSTFPYGDDQSNTVQVSTVTDLGNGTWRIVFASPLTIPLAVGDCIAKTATATARVLTVSAADTYIVDTGDVTAASFPTLLRAATSIVEWSLKPAPSPFELKVYRDSRLVWNAIQMMTAYTMTYQSGTQVAGEYTTLAQSVTVPIQYSPADYLRTVGVPIDAALAGTFQAYVTVKQGGAGWLLGGFAVSWEPGGEALSQ